MGKTTLCDTLMGLVRPTAGEVLLHGERIDGPQPERIAAAGISYVPQGRRLFASLTVDEHLAMLAKGTRASAGRRRRCTSCSRGWPSARQRRRRPVRRASSRCWRRPGAAAQRLARADGRAVEGLAPTIVDVLVEAVHRLVAEGTAVLVVEQKLLAATAMAERQLVMVSGRIRPRRPRRNCARTQSCNGATWASAAPSRRGSKRRQHPRKEGTHDRLRQRGADRLEVHGPGSLQRLAQGGQVLPRRPDAGDAHRRRARRR
jgi:branched-chain amino acid transport system ATP-binding protein